MSGNSKTQRDIDWENRILCSDESCIGVIGPDGRCKECGKPYAGELPFASSPASETADPPEAAASTAPAEKDDPESDAVPDKEWENRTLCSDESCIGVIGPDGRCKECGKPYQG